MSTSSTSTDADEIARAERSVAEHKAELSRSLRQVGHSSERLARRVGEELKPAVVVAVAVAGAAGAAALAIALTRRARRRPSWFGPEEPSRLAIAAKTAGIWALRLVARRVAQELVSRLSEPTPTEPAPQASPAE